MRAEAIVLEVSGDIAKVRSVRQSACASCANGESKNHCHAMLIFGEQEQSIEIDAHNTAHAKVGDRVMLASSGTNVLLLSVFVFFLPVLLSVASYFVSVHFFVQNYIHYAFLLAVFVISFALGCFFGNRYTKNRLKTEIVKIIEESRE